jgi:hypothetical protein
MILLKKPPVLKIHEKTAKTVKQRILQNRL